MEPFDIIGNTTEPLFKIILVTTKEMFYLTKLMSLRPFLERSTTYRHAILEYIRKIGSYVRNSLQNSL